MSSKKNESSPPAGHDPEIDELLDTLSHYLRREVIHYFEHAAAAETVPLSDMVAHIDNRVPAPADTIRIQLHHTHLPRLEERDWLDYTPETDTIHYHGHERADALLADIRETL